MGLLNRGRRKDDKKFDETVAYDKYQSGNKIDELIMLYDEKSIILFERSKPRPSIKKI